ncbi:MAG: TRAP transporter small permease subunit [Burkholderiaceae bacterium]
MSNGSIPPPPASLSPTTTPAPASGAGRILHQGTAWIATVAFLALVIIALLTFYDGLARTLGLARINGFSDYTVVLFGIVIAGCFPAGLLNDNNVTIRLVGKAAGPRTSHWLEVLGAFLTLVFFALIAWQFVLLTLDYAANNRTTRTIELRLAPWWWVTTVLISLTVPVQCWVLWSRWRRARGFDGTEVN